MQEPEKSEIRLVVAEPLLGDLRAVLAQDLLEASLRRAAVTLGTSPRSLQRRLRELGTSFRAELAEARVREGKRRMQSAGLPLTTIALDLGFASIQGFRRCFRRSTGVYPRAWRTATSALVVAESGPPAASGPPPAASVDAARSA